MPKVTVAEAYAPLAVLPAPPEPFDLVTFPEAFLPLESFLDFLAQLDSLPKTCGCIHVGLRADDATRTHLIGHAQLLDALHRIRGLRFLRSSDLDAFSDWLSTEAAGGFYNVGAIFSWDAEGYLRLCLHPKLLRSRYEHNVAAERNMKEASLLSAVLLRPTDGRLPPLTIQPLLCSDALQNQQRDDGLPAPMYAFEADLEGTEEESPRPEQVDVVSIAAFTPLSPTTRPGAGRGRYRWKREFLDTLRIAAEGAQGFRHTRSAILLANYATDAKGKPGGASGIWVPWMNPVMLDSEHFETLVYAHPDDRSHASLCEEHAYEESDWIPADAIRMLQLPKPAPRLGWNVLGSLTTLRTIGERSGSTRLIGLTLHRIPRFVSGWAASQQHAVTGAIAFDVAASELGDSVIIREVASG
ncbi:hypothetical protein [Vulgatibacter sp.]|uniref:hypothetical protein n=1 Tax=Vulgatibacter sp. TaxID=1971226 RepID=UPI00356335DC